MDIVFPTTSTVGAKPQEGGGSLLNAFVEQLSTGARKQIVRKRVPGMTKIVEADARINCRGIAPFGANAFVAFNDRLFELSGSGTSYFMDDRGQLSGTKPITVAQNNRAPDPQIVAVTENGAFQFFSGGAPASYPDSDVGFPNSVCFGDGYFFFTYGDGTCRSSGLNSTDINTNDRITTEAGNGSLLRGVFFRQELWLFCQDHIEVWQDTANANGFPFSRSTVIPRGLKGQWAVAGEEEGFSNVLIWVGDDNTVYNLNGYAPVRISTHDVERSIGTVTDVSTLRATVYMSEGHAIWQIKGPGFTWCYDLTTSQWHQRASYGRPEWMGEQTAFYNGSWIVGDDTTGKLYRMNAQDFTEDGANIIWEVTSAQMASFPNRFSVPRADFDFDMGVGLDTGSSIDVTDPRVLVSYSDDGGYYYSEPEEFILGRQGQASTRVTVLQTGEVGPYGRQWKIQCPDPVYCGLLGGDMQVVQRKS